MYMSIKNKKKEIRKMKKEITKEVFKSIDLRTQLTEELKNRWYYQQVKWGLRINKKSVVFDDSFKFVVEYVKEFIAPETKDIPFGNTTFHIEKGEVLSDPFIIVKLDGYMMTDPETGDMLYIDEDSYSSIEDILGKIVIYIAKYI